MRRIGRYILGFGLVAILPSLQLQAFTGSVTLAVGTKTSASTRKIYQELSHCLSLIFAGRNDAANSYASESRG